MAQAEGSPTAVVCRSVSDLGPSQKLQRVPVRVLFRDFEKEPHCSGELFGHPGQQREVMWQCLPFPMPLSDFIVGHLVNKCTESAPRCTDYTDPKGQLHPVSACSVAEVL